MRVNGKFAKGIEANRSKARQTNVLKARSCRLSAAVVAHVSENIPELPSSLSTPVAGNASSCISSDHSYTNSSSFDFINETFFSGRLRPISNTRFVVDLQTLFDNMKCNYCDLELKMKDAVGVLPAGITGHLVFRCFSCYRYVRTAMGKVHRAHYQNRGPPVFDVNSKLATAIHHSGIGPTQANNFLTTLNLPFVSSFLFQKRSQEVSDTFQKVAQSSIDMALQKEVEMTIYGDTAGHVGLGCKTDTPQLAATESAHHCQEGPLMGDTAGHVGQGCKMDMPQLHVAATESAHHCQEGPLMGDTAGHAGQGCRMGMPQLAATESAHHCQEGSLMGDTAGHVGQGCKMDMPQLAATESAHHCQEGSLMDFNSVASAPDINIPGRVASADGAYQKRGSGKCHNSLSGTATLIGKNTGKVVAATSRSKRYRICSVAKKRRVTPRKHKCVRNWTGSAKSMEADMVVDMLKTVKEKDATVVTLIGDDDTTGFQRAREEVFKEMEKVSDSNHVKKNISNQLFKLKEKYKEMSVKIINALIKSFGYMLAQSKGSVDLIQDNVESVVHHQFGVHDKCGAWCRMKTDGSRKHKNLPWGADLKNEHLKEDILKIFKKLDVQKLSKLDSTNPNESFNNILRSKAPKDKHYSESVSLQNRLAAAVCQKNEGYSYVSKINEDLRLSPGNATTMCARLRDKDVARQRDVCKTKKFKLRRLQLKSDRGLETRSAEVREGDTYSSDIMDGTKELDTRRIPEIGTEPKFVYFDVETTGLARTSSITQISAVCGEVVFNEFATPKEPVSDEAEAVTGISFDFHSNQMTQHGVEKEHKHTMNVLLDFIDFLKLFGHNIILVAHNCRNFDCIILYNQLLQNNLWKYFCSFVIGFSDTLPFFKQLYPEFQKHNQATLALEILGEKYAAHDALEDSKMLQKLVMVTGSEKMLCSTFFFSVCQITAHGVQYASCTIQYLCSKNVVSKSIAKNFLDSSLNYDCLELAFTRDGYDGLYALLSERNIATGKPRVSKCHKVIQKLVDYFAQIKLV